jgi:hypothetical protein
MRIITSTDITGFTVRAYEPAAGEPFADIEVRGTDGTTRIELRTPADCDELIRAAAEAKRLLTPPPQCTAVRQFGGHFAYCDAEGDHDEHRAPGLNQGDPDLTWTDAEALGAWQQELAGEITRVAIGDGPVPRDAEGITGMHWDNLGHGGGE